MRGSLRSDSGGSLCRFHDGDKSGMTYLIRMGRDVKTRLIERFKSGSEWDLCAWRDICD